MRGESGVAGEGTVVGVPMFHSWGKCTMPLTNIKSHRMPNASSGLRINLYYLFYAGPLSCILGSKNSFSNNLYCKMNWAAALPLRLIITLCNKSSIHLIIIVYSVGL